MRRKIAKRKRKYLMSKGAEITAEYWETEPEWRRKDCCYVVEFTYNGWHIVAPEKDELEAFKAAIECMVMHDELEARKENGNG